MNFQNIKIGTLLGVGIVGIIFVMTSVTLYSNHLSRSIQETIETSTTRIWDVLAIQRDMEEFISALEDLVVLLEQYELDEAKERVERLFKRAEATLDRGIEEQIFIKSEAVQLDTNLKKALEISDRIFELKEDLVGQPFNYGMAYGNTDSQTIIELNNEFDRLRRLRHQIFGSVGEVIKRSDQEFRKTMNLLQRSQMVTWAVVGLGLIFALILAYFLVKFAKKIYEVKNEFINIIAHDLRNPVTSIIGFLDIIKTGKKEDLDEHINIIHASALKLRNQINNLLEVGRSETGTLRMDLEPVNLTEVLDESVKRAKAIALALKMKIEYQENTGLPKVRAEKNKITDVIDNLISNALKYNRDNGIVTISSAINDKKVTISVSDNGYGIPEEDKDKIFKKYSRLGGKSKKKRGTGLGLYTAKMLVEKMGGSISFTSEKDKGTTFFVSLNIANT